MPHANLQQCRSLLSPEEEQRASRLVIPHVQLEYTVARTLVRLVLSEYGPVAPQAWEFETNEFGRPEILSPATFRKIRFNLTHSHGMIACAVTQSCDIGVDVEHVDRMSDFESIAERSYAPAELDELRSVPVEQRKQRFFDFWTLKEAYIKARGMGLTIPLDRFWFDLEEPHGPCIVFDPRLDDDPAAWQFRSMAMPPAYRLALAVRCGKGREMDVSLRSDLPFPLGIKVDP